MSKWFMVTGPLKGFKRQLKIFLEKGNPHVQAYSYSIEEGEKAVPYIHYHLKICCSGDNVFALLCSGFYPGHVEESNDNLDYLRKPGNKRYVASNETTKVRICRHIKDLWPWQNKALKLLNMQSDRDILVYVDDLGNSGKSFFTLHLYETNRAFWVPPVLSTPKDIIQFVTSGYRGQEFIIIDIPRSWKWSDQLYTAIEMIKDGLIFDTRYKCTLRNIRGVKIVIFCNTKPKLDKLSRDRWNIWYRDHKVTAPWYINHEEGAPPEGALLS